jgi:hypothetical protein
MADFESALSDLGMALAATNTKLSTSLAEILGVAIQKLIEAELTALIGAGPGERSATRTAQRNATGTDPRSSRRRRVASRWGSPSCGRARSSPSCSSPAPHRQGVVGGDHDRVHHRHLHEEGR